MDVLQWWRKSGRKCLMIEGKTGDAMGGYGSGRWGWHTKATTVEAALALPTTHLRTGLHAIADGKARIAHGTLQ